MITRCEWSLSDLFQNISENMISAVTEKYLGQIDDPVKKKDRLLDLFGDVIFGIPSVLMARGLRGESYMLNGRMWTQITSL